MGLWFSGTYELWSSLCFDAVMDAGYSDVVRMWKFWGGGAFLFTFDHGGGL